MAPFVKTLRRNFFLPLVSGLLLIFCLAPITGLSQLLRFPFASAPRKLRVQILTHSSNHSPSEWVSYEPALSYSLSSWSFPPHFLFLSLPLSYYTVGLSAKPCRKRSREMVPKLCCTLESPKDLRKP